MLYSMRKFLCLSLILLGYPLFAQAFDVGGEIQIAKAYVQTFHDTFMKSIIDEDPACELLAPGLSSAFSIESGAKVERVSLNPRNPLSLPDKWEREQLVRFLQKTNNGNNLEQEEIFEMTQEGRQQYFRYIKPIIVQQRCLSCHGTIQTIGKEKFEAQLKKYPHDKAWGHSLNQLRGAYSYKKPI